MLLLQKINNEHLNCPQQNGQGDIFYICKKNVTMLKFYSCLLVVLFSLRIVSGQTTTFTDFSPLATEVLQLEKVNTAPANFAPFSISTFMSSAHDNIIDERTYLNVDVEQLHQIISNQFGFLEMDVPFEGAIITVQLFPSNLFTADFQVVTSSGEQIDYSAGAQYRGIIKGDFSSLVAFSFFDNHISGIISTKTAGNIVLSNLKNSSTHVIYRDKNLKIANPLNCATPDADAPISMPEGPAAAAAIDPCVRVYIEADFEMYEDEGGAVQAADQIVGFFNVSSTIYFNEGITDIISEIYVWTSADPYPTTSSGDALEYFKDYRVLFNGDLAHLVTYDDENLGGVAYVPALCSDYTYAYSNIYNFYSDFPTYSWTVDVFTHEMGHNLGSPHTHSCSWPGGAIDNCYTPEGGCDPGPEPTDGGTIMSYCHLTGYGKNFALGFGPLPGALIFDEVNDAGCLGACDLPPVNDWPCAATTLPVNEDCIFISGTNVGAINSVIAPVGCDGPSEGDIWFSVTIPAEGYVIIDTDNGPVVNNMGMKVYSGICTALGGYPDGCVSDGSTYAPLMPGITITGTPGTTYLLRLWEVGNDDFGSFSICAYTDCAASSAADAIIATDDLICAGESTTLSVSGGALGTGGVWNWYSGSCGGTLVGTGESITVNPAATTTYYLNAVGECNTTTCVSKTIGISPAPAVPVITNSNCNLSVSFIAGATYTWFLDGVEIAGVSDNTISVTEDGNYSVTIETAEGCTATSASTSVDCQDIAIQNINTPEIFIYPNPGNGNFTIQLDGISGEINVVITDITGQLIATQTKKLSAANNTIAVELNVAAGIYFVKAGKPGAFATEVLIIE